MKLLSSRKAAEALGVHAQTLRAWDKQGLIKAIRTPSNQRLYDITSITKEVTSIKQIVYCRVSSCEQKDDLQRQVEEAVRRYPKAELIKDIGSGLNYKRVGLTTILERVLDGDKLQVMVAHKDRLARFGFELIKWLVEKRGGEIVVYGNDASQSPEQELTQDLLTILHVFSCRMHGLRRYYHQIKDDKDLPNSGTKTNFKKMD